MIEFKLPQSFLIGTATASVQIEGGDTNNTWYKWCEDGHIKDASHCIIANNHWNMVEEDTLLLKELNVQTHRMSIEWSRIEPSKGIFSKEALEHYKNEIELLISNNIIPIVTLHHFSEPLWFQNEGGWLKAESINIFLEYVKYVVEGLGEYVSQWVTFNEPNVYSIFGYLVGIWPPGRNRIREYFKVQSRIIAAHILAYTLIHNIRKYKEFPGETKVGAAVHIRIFDSTTWLGNKVARLADYFFHKLIMEGTVNGRILKPLSKNGYKFAKGRYVDFLGINYYTRNVVEFTLNPFNYFGKLRFDDDLEKNDLGWDIYPQGIYRVCRKYYDLYKLPIYITESGIADKEDTKRADFICNHLVNIERCLEEGIPVERYYYWTLIDNFEWTEGETAQFGLYDCNFQNQERIIRKSGKLFGQICKDRKLTDEMIEEYENITI